MYIILKSLISFGYSYMPEQQAELSALPSELIDYMIEHEFIIPIANAARNATPKKSTKKSTPNK